MPTKTIYIAYVSKDNDDWYDYDFEGTEKPIYKLYENIPNSNELKENHFDKCVKVQYAVELETSKIILSSKTDYIYGILETVVCEDSVKNIISIIKDMADYDIKTLIDVLIFITDKDDTIFYSTDSIVSVLEF